LLRWRRAMTRRGWRDNDDNDDGDGGRCDGRRDTTTMAADYDNNEVDGNGVTGNDDGYVR